MESKNVKQRLHKSVVRIFRTTDNTNKKSKFYQNNSLWLPVATKSSIK